MSMNEEEQVHARMTALDRALQFHTPRPHVTVEDIIATAEKFAGYLLVEKKTVEPRA